MHHSLLGVLRVVVSICLVLLVAGCGEDPRYSARTQYLGGGYGGAPAGAPRDTVSYWDGDSAGGSPSVKISLGEQRAYFYKGGVLVGVSQLSTGREGLNTTLGHFKIIQKDKDHVSSLFGDYVDSAGNVVVPNVDINKDPKPPGAHFSGTPMPYFMRIVSGTGRHAGDHWRNWAGSASSGKATGRNGGCGSDRAGVEALQTRRARFSRRLLCRSRRRAFG